MKLCYFSALKDQDDRMYKRLGAYILCLSIFKAYTKEILNTFTLKERESGFSRFWEILFYKHKQRLKHRDLLHIGKTRTQSQSLQLLNMGS